MYFFIVIQSTYSLIVELLQMYVWETIIPTTIEKSRIYRIISQSWQCNIMYFGNIPLVNSSREL